MCKELTITATYRNKWVSSATDLYDCIIGMHKWTWSYSYCVYYILALAYIASSTILPTDVVPECEITETYRTIQNNSSRSKRYMNIPGSVAIPGTFTCRSKHRKGFDNVHECDTKACELPRYNINCNNTCHLYMWVGTVYTVWLISTNCKLLIYLYVICILL